MLTYLIIILDDTSVSYCHYSYKKTDRKLISLDDLKEGILFAMKENLNIQFVYPNYVIPKEYREVIESIDHTKIGPSACGEDLDVIVVDDLDFEVDKSKNYLWRCTINELSEDIDKMMELLPKVQRLNIVLTDILDWKEKAFVCYQEILSKMAVRVAEYYSKNILVQVNLLTDRLVIDKMNNCNAGYASITLAPDGKFYICPAYYGKKNVGTPKDGLYIANQQLYRIDHAPICRKCDAFQCKRCIWMNEISTLDCNTPSHEQCVVAHMERRASCQLNKLLETKGVTIVNSYPLEDVNYLDPFNILTKWN